MTGIGLGGYGVKDRVALSAATLAKLYTISFGKREWGMFVTVYADANPLNNIVWYLKYNESSTNKNDNANWVDASTVIGGGGGGGNMNLVIANYDASGGNFPLSGIGITKGTVYIVGIAGSLDDGAGGFIDVVPGAWLTAETDNPGNNKLGWSILQ